MSQITSDSIQLNRIKQEWNIRNNLASVFLDKCPDGADETEWTQQQERLKTDVNNFNNALPPAYRISTELLFEQPVLQTLAHFHQTHMQPTPLKGILATWLVKSEQSLEWFQQAYCLSREISESLDKCDIDGELVRDGSDAYFDLSELTEIIRDTIAAAQTAQTTRIQGSVLDDDPIGSALTKTRQLLTLAKVPDCPRDLSVDSKAGGSLSQRVKDLSTALRMELDGANATKVMALKFSDAVGATVESTKVSDLPLKE